MAAQGGYPYAGYPQGGPQYPGYPQATPQGYPGYQGQPQGYPQYPQGYPQPYPQPGYPAAGYPPQQNPVGYVPPGQAVQSTLGEDEEVKGFDFTDQSIRKSFIRKVYSILMCQLLVTIGFIALCMFERNTRTWVRQNPWVVYVAFVVILVCIISMACCTEMRRTPPMNFIFLGIFTAAQGFVLGVTTSFYDTTAVLMAVGITAAICLALTLFAFQTKWDFTTMGGILMCGLVVLLLFGIIAIFIPRSNILTLVYGCLGALLFSFYLIYDTQMMMGGKHKYSISPEEYIFAALNLYLDIVNIFMYILMIIGASKN